MIDLLQEPIEGETSFALEFEDSNKGPTGPMLLLQALEFNFESSNRRLQQLLGELLVGFKFLMQYDFCLFSLFCSLA